MAGAVALAVGVAGIMAADAFGATAAAAPTRSVTVSPAVNVVDYVVVKPGRTVTADLSRHVPASATSATFTVTARFAWRATNVSVCPGSSASASCRKAPALAAPVQDKRTTTTTVTLDQSRRVTVHNSSASARVTLTLVRYAVPASASTPSPTASARPIPDPAPVMTTTLPSNSLTGLQPSGMRARCARWRPRRCGRRGRR